MEAFVQEWLPDEPRFSSYGRLVQQYSNQAKRILTGEYDGPSDKLSYADLMLLL